MKASGANNKPVFEQVKEYDLAWTEMMGEIWQKRIELLHARRTGHLHNSIRGELQHISEDFSATMRFDFPRYGIYVENGTGYGFKNDNGGDLPFMDPLYRAEHDLDRPGKKVGPAWGGYVQSGGPRQKKYWMSPSWGISRRVLGGAMTKFIGTQFYGMVDNLNT